MQKILLTKTGAAGDIVRTTVLLQALPGKITWVAGSRYIDLLPKDHPAIEKILSPEQAATELKNEQFDLTISLEEDIDCARLASAIPTKKIVGIYEKDGKLSYTDDSAGWFDMSLVSKKGSQFAKEAKWKNDASFQDHLFNMLGMSFNGEQYCIYRNSQVKPEKKLVGIETRSSARWPNKTWGGYQALTDQLQKAGYSCLQLQERNNISDYLDDIARCSFLVSGDTLAMHVALAYQVPVIGIFNCTSPTEIYDYGLLKKMVSPLLQQSFYSLEYSAEVVQSISPETVFRQFLEHIQLTQRLQKV